MTTLAARDVLAGVDGERAAGVAWWASLARRLDPARDIPAALRAVAATAVEAVPGARWASVARAVDGRPAGCAASDPVAVDVDALQHGLGAGPSVAVRDGLGLCVSRDLAADPRWPEFGARAAAGYAVHSVFARGVEVDAAEAFRVMLTLYADHAGAFDAAAREEAECFFVAARLALAGVANRDLARHLARAQSSNREIGIAVGVLMTTYLLTREQAFEVLRFASQNSNRKLRDIAAEVGDTGVLDIPAVRVRLRRRAVAVR